MNVERIIEVPLTQPLAICWTRSPDLSAGLARVASGQVRLLAAEDPEIDIDV
ncbi:MAG: hypothetical protein WCJ35_06615 [Planctomycetota bacterium]